jgi:pentapeptide MXKDX repeat protein
MKNTLLVTACVAALSAFTAFGASAQATGPAAQDGMKTNDMSNTGMKKDGMDTKGMAKDGIGHDEQGRHVEGRHEEGRNVQVADRLRSGFRPGKFHDG